MGATLDRVSGGRFAMNVVNGWWPEEFNTYGNGSWLAEADRRYRRMNEFVQVVKGLWTEEEFSFVGEFYRLDKASLPTKPVTRPNPPIYNRNPCRTRARRRGGILRLLVRPAGWRFSSIRRSLCPRVESDG